MSRSGCSHRWMVEGTSYTPPVTRIKAERISPVTVRRLVEGITHVYMRCIYCGDLKEQDVHGEYISK